MRFPVTAALAAVFAAVALAVPAAQATQGQSVIAGQYNDSTSVTRLDNTNEGSSLSGGSEQHDGIGVIGMTNDGFFAAVYARNKGAGPGAAGNSVDGNGTEGYHTNANTFGYGVYGKSENGAGVVGQGTKSHGVIGFTSAPGYFALYGNHQSSNSGYGVWGSAVVGTGVHGDGTVNGVEGTSQKVGVKGTSTAAAGTGVIAENTAVGGTALNVKGKASFSRSGVITLSSSSSSVQKSAIPLTSSSYVLATIQTNTPGVFVRAAVPDVAGSKVTIFFSATAPAGTKVAWFVVN
jgi:hypothetical protein